MQNIAYQINNLLLVDNKISITKISNGRDNNLKIVFPNNYVLANFKEFGGRKSLHKDYNNNTYTFGYI